MIVPTGAAAAHAELSAASATVAECVATLRTATRVGWESPAADEFRAAVAGLTALLEAEAAGLSAAAAVASGLSR